MTLDLSAPTPLRYFAALVHGDEPLPLLEAAASLAQDEHPELDLQQVLSDMDQLAERLRRRVNPRGAPAERLRTLNQVFFGELGFAGNVNDYYDPENSYLHAVLRRRRGIPISLAVPWLELARGLGLRAEGIGFPGHFLVHVVLEEGRVVIDPFTGDSLSRADLRERVEQIAPGPTDDQTLEYLLRPTGARAILARMLRNLRDIHRVHENWPRLVAVHERLVALLPEAWDEYRDRGLALAELGEATRARADLALYLRHAVGAADWQAVQQRLVALSGRPA